jgi:hypothetical protein
MARSTRKSLLLPQPVADALDIQRERGVVKYASLNAFLVGLARYQCLAPGAHLVTEPIANMGQADQDVIDDFLLALNSKGLRYRSQLLEHLLRGDSPAPTSQPDIPGQLLKTARLWKADPAAFDWSNIGKDPNQLELGI